ncbi:MAG: CoA transferase [Dehalococcoidia bacterium]|nr:CoA transferase [Dehalococcoidia bacterium]
MSGCLQGVKVVELGHWVVAPAACAILADWGADVIKIEEPGVGDPQRGVKSIESTPMRNGIHYFFEAINRNKRGIAVDLRQKRGRDIVTALIKRSDVFVSNLRLQVLSKYGLDYTSLSKLNSRLVHAVVTGYGTVGPDKDKPGYDYSAFWARSGAMHKVSESGRPPRPQRPGFGDETTSLCLAAGISAALFDRERSGVGQELTLSLYHTALWALLCDVQVALSTGKEIPQSNQADAKNPIWNTYRTQDGRWLQLVMPQSDRFWARFCGAIGQPCLARDPRFESHEKREQNNKALIAIIDEAMAARTLAEWERILEAYDMVSSRVQTVSEVATDPQAIENGFFAELDHPVVGRVKLVASPVKFGRTAASVRSPAPEVGQHTEEVLLELGYSWENIATLRSEGVI